MSNPTAPFIGAIVTVRSYNPVTGTGTDKAAIVTQFDASRNVSVTIFGESCEPAFATSVPYVWNNAVPSSPISGHVWRWPAD